MGLLRRSRIDGLPPSLLDGRYIQEIHGLKKRGDVQFHHNLLKFVDRFAAFPPIYRIPESMSGEEMRVLRDI
jgi:hypothetical protein